MTRKGRRAHAPGHLPRTFGPVTAPKNGSSLGSLSEFSLAEARLRAMDWVHGRSRVISGASRLHHVAGITQVTPGGPTNEWQGLRAQQPRTGLLASKWVFGKDLSTASTPVAMTGLVGFGTWGMGRRKASLAETPERAETPGRAETPEEAETPEGAESNTGTGCRAASPGWLW